MSLLSSWDEMDVPVKLLAGDVWAAEDDKTGFLVVGVGISKSIIFVRTSNCLFLIVPMSTIKQNYDKWG